MKDAGWTLDRVHGSHHIVVKDGKAVPVPHVDAHEKLDKYEKQILRAYGKEEIVSTAPTKEEKKLFVAAAKATSLPRRPVRQQATS